MSYVRQKTVQAVHGLDSCSSLENFTLDERTGRRLPPLRTFEQALPSHRQKQISSQMFAVLVFLNRQGRFTAICKPAALAPHSQHRRDFS